MKIIFCSGGPACNQYKQIHKKNFEGMKSKRRATGVLGIGKHSMLVESYVFWPAKIASILP
jgi:hypothetical protein